MVVADFEVQYRDGVSLCPPEMSFSVDLERQGSHFEAHSSGRTNRGQAIKRPDRRFRRSGSDL